MMGLFCNVVVDLRSPGLRLPTSTRRNYVHNVDCGSPCDVAIKSRRIGGGAVVVRLACWKGGVAGDGRWLYCVSCRELSRVD